MDSSDSEAAIPRAAPLRGLFVTGTDTGVGKTVVCAALMHRYRGETALRYWKPIQTGIEHDDDTADVERLGGCGRGELFTAGVRLPLPVSPHLAARLGGTVIDIAPLAASAEGAGDGRSWIAEGAGGVLVPINQSELMSDLIARLGLPVLLVARTTLGTINHTLLTIDALRRRDLPVAGVVMVGDRDEENRLAIEHYGDVAVIGEMPRLTPLTSTAVEAWARSGLDREGRLLERLR